jgi:hypothetical protein
MHRKEQIGKICEEWLDKYVIVSILGWCLQHFGIQSCFYQGE